MITIPIKKLEKNLGYSIKKNIFVLAIDTATTSGITKMWIDAKNVKIDLLTIKCPSAPKETEENSEKYEEFIGMATVIFRDFTKTVQQNKQNTLLVLENSFLGLNVSTYGFLKVMMGILHTLLYDYFETIKIYYPTQARKMVGFHSSLKRKKGMTSKEKTAARKERKEEIITFINNILGTEITDDNIADSLLLAFAGIKE